MAEMVPEVVVMRLPLYVRVLSMLEASEQELVSSQTLGALLQATVEHLREQDTSTRHLTGLDDFVIEPLLQPQRHLFHVVCRTGSPAAMPQDDKRPLALFCIHQLTFTVNADCLSIPPLPPFPKGNLSFPSLTKRG